MAYPVSRGTLVNVAIFDVDYAAEGTAIPEPWVSDVEPDTIHGMFKGWESEVEDIIAVSNLSDFRRSGSIIRYVHVSVSGPTR